MPPVNLRYLESAAAVVNPLECHSYSSSLKIAVVFLGGGYDAIVKVYYTQKNIFLLE